MTFQSGAPAATQVSRLVDVNGNPLGVSANPFIVTSSGTIMQTDPLPTQTNLVPSRTDTSTFTSADFTTPAFQVAIFTLRITAVSGTTPTLVLSVLGKSSQGDYSAQFGGGAIASQNATGTVALVLTPSATTSVAMLPPLFHILAQIAGTTPSFTWYLDMVYK